MIAVVWQTPDRNGVLNDFSQEINAVHKLKSFAIVGTDLLAQCVSKSVGDMGADIAYGNGQRFGVPLGYGGPHAAFFASKRKLIRQAPGRIIGISKDPRGKDGFRISLSTREQHIKRERATSNICTAQVLLSNMNFFYCLWHGEDGLVSIAQRVNYLTQRFCHLLSEHNVQPLNYNPEAKV